MRVAVLILAIIGGVLGVFFAILAMLVGGIAEEIAGEGGEIIGLGLSALGAAILGIICGATSFGSRWKKLSALGLIIAAVWHAISISLFAIPAVIFFAIAGLLAFFVKGTRSAERPAEEGDQSTA